MRTATAASVGLHTLVLAALLLHWRWPTPRPAEVPAQIAMIFGKNARAEGAPASRAAAARPKAATPAAASPAASPAAARQPAAAVPPPEPPSAHLAPAAPPAAAVPVRLGDGMVGFDVDKPDPGIVPAIADPGNRPPPYPDSAWRRREHGKVVLRIHVGPDGLVAGIDTLQSSGFEDLDDAATAAARHWRFIPQFRDGRPVPSVRDQALDFILE